jgi:hypothetical protein
MAAAGETSADDLQGMLLVAYDRGARTRTGAAELVKELLLATKFAPEERRRIGSYCKAFRLLMPMQETWHKAPAGLLEIRDGGEWHARSKLKLSVRAPRGRRAGGAALTRRARARRPRGAARRRRRARGGATC